ncbi:dysbindin-like isoform X3 [Genypterus blacodes]|uniref:dysbindin-like isoform X3 n=1 Tax=Genypterus blacodes TaxID=154954 RepID=UPI003F75EFE9
MNLRWNGIYGVLPWSFDRRVRDESTHTPRQQQSTVIDWTMSSGSTNHNKRLALETDNSQRMLDNDAAQQLKLRERQRFFEEVIQHDVDNYLPSTHLQIDCRKPPMGSISSMEVNVDMLEQMDLMDISDHEALDVFLNSGSGDDAGAFASPLPVNQSLLTDQECVYSSPQRERMSMKMRKMRMQK